ncbi:MAG: 4-(cytidine 5'-diphospho)-2-C-methyl-D-erythritol kinase, partial [Albidovulum sp.]
LPDFTDLHDLAKFLARMRNDLEPAAIKAAPAIANVLAALTSMSGCLLARMSGSGATCFGIFADQTLAAAAARTISDAKPDWWVAAAPVLA